MRQSEERGKGDSAPLHPKGSSSSSMAEEVRYTAGRRGTRNEDVQSGRGSSSTVGRVEYIAGWRWRREGIPSSADLESASCTSSSTAGGLVIRRGGKGGLASTYPLPNEEVVC